MGAGLKAKDIMTSGVKTVTPHTPLPELDEHLLADGVSGYPVVDGERLVGVVSRADIVRQLGVETSLAGQLSDYYRDVSPAWEKSASLQSEAAEVGVRLAGLSVQDVMSSSVLSAAIDDDLVDVARTLVQNDIHRVPVVDGERLIGIITSMDLVRVLAERDVRVGSAR